MEFMNLEKLMFLVVISALGLLLILITYSIPWASGRASRLEEKRQNENKDWDLILICYKGR